MQNHKILIAKRDIGRGQVLADHLNKSGFEVASVSSAAEMYESAKLHPFDGFVVDIALNNEAPVAFINKLRAYGQSIPIIVMLEPEEIADTKFCLNLDADDYIVKIVNPYELDMRLKSILRRLQDDRPSMAKLQFGHLVLDYARRAAVDVEEQLIELTLAEFSVIWALASSDGKVLSRNDLIKEMSFDSAPVSIRAVDILISRVRKKLGKEAVQTVSKVGYRCGWPVSPL